MATLLGGSLLRFETPETNEGGEKKKKDGRQSLLMEEERPVLTGRSYSIRPTARQGTQKDNHMEEERPVLTGRSYSIRPTARQGT